MGKHRGLKSKWAQQFFSRVENEAKLDGQGCDHTCSRCGVVIPLFVDPITKRLDYVPCIRHLTGDVDSGIGSKRSREETADTAPLCSAGVLPYDADTAWFELKKRGNTKSDSSPLSSNQGHTLKSASSAKIDACVLSLVRLAEAVALHWAQKEISPPASVIGLLNPKTPVNYGAILRACGCYAKKIHTNDDLDEYDSAVIFSDARLSKALEFQQEAFANEVGEASSASPLQGNRAPKGRGVSRTDTMAAGLRIPQWHIERLEDYAAVMLKLRMELDRQNGLRLESGQVPLIIKFIAVDLIEGAQSLPLFPHFLEDACVPQVVVYLFGPEDGSIPSSILRECDGAVFITTTGSLNLSATVNVLLYDRLCKWEQIHLAKSQNSNLPLSWLATPLNQESAKQISAAHFDAVANRNSNNKTRF